MKATWIGTHIQTSADAVGSMYLRLMRGQEEVTGTDIYIWGPSTESGGQFDFRS